MKEILTRIFIISVFTVGSALAAESGTYIHEATTAPSGARFEIIQSTVAAKLTFRLDRFTGRVWQLVKTDNEENAWEEMEVSGLTPNTASTQAKFQIFSSGIAARYTFLLDTTSGRTWVVVTGSYKTQDGDKVEYNSWQPFPGQ